MNSSCQEMWREWCKFSDNRETFESDYSVWHFCDNKNDANKCAKLVLEGKKRASTPSLWELEKSGKKLPEIGDLSIITDWSGEAQCIIRTTGVDIMPFNEVTAEYAELEGEGDGSLEYWRDTHEKYYRRVLEDTSYEFAEDMPVVRHRFVVIFPLWAAD